MNILQTIKDTLGSLKLILIFLLCVGSVYYKKVVHKMDMEYIANYFILSNINYILINEILLN